MLNGSLAPCPTYAHGCAATTFPVSFTIAFATSSCAPGLSTFSVVAVGLVRFAPGELFPRAGGDRLAFPPPLPAAAVAVVSTG